MLDGGYATRCAQSAPDRDLPFVVVHDPPAQCFVRRAMHGTNGCAMNSYDFARIGTFYRTAQTALARDLDVKYYVAAASRIHVGTSMIMCSGKRSCGPVSGGCSFRYLKWVRDQAVAKSPIFLTMDAVACRAASRFLLRQDCANLGYLENGL